MKPVPTLLLGVVHGLIGFFYEFTLICTIIRIDADANTGADEQFVPGNYKWMRKEFNNLLGNPDRLLRGIGISQEYDKFVAAETGNTVLIALAAFFQTLCHCLEELIADSMTVGVIDGFKPVKVEIKEVR